MTKEERARLLEALEARGVTEDTSDMSDNDLYSFALGELAKPPRQGPLPETFEERREHLATAADDEGIANPTHEAVEKLGLVPRPDKPHVYVTGQAAERWRQRMVAGAQ